MNFRYTVIGAGVIGLAVARSLLQHCRPGETVLVVEKEGRFGCGISSRNSEVIHAGIYYPTHSLKHTLCIAGRRMLYAYCDAHKVPHAKCGKLIVATTPEEETVLEDVEKQALANGVEAVRRLTRSQALEMEPDIKVFSALFSEETGMIDTHKFMQSMAAEIEAAGGIIAYGAAVTDVELKKGDYVIRLADDTVFHSGYVINAAGLQALEISKMIGVEPVRLHPCKGSYFYYTGKHRVKHLVYPVPEKKLTGLGVHATLDLTGRLKFGPDTEYVHAGDDYEIDEGKKKSFFEAAQKIIPSVKYDQLVPDMAGIRPKIQGPEDPVVKDFYICEEKTSPKWINLLGIESPGLTCALAIGDYVVQDIIGLA
ncbi:NAD(P)/FAD-dependent oxidoreductase [bacterium]|nr:NAD(P)/FAD-dependent oxidoreductase [bacterium]